MIDTGAGIQTPTCHPERSEGSRCKAFSQPRVNTDSVPSGLTSFNFTIKSASSELIAAYKYKAIGPTTEPLNQDTEVVGPIALYLYAAISSEDADFIVKLKDVSPEGTESVLTRGWLKASHRELDMEKSKPWQPYHPHTRAVPVVPGEINEYAIEIRPISNLFRKGHRIKAEIWSCDYPSDKVDRTLDWPGWSHLSYDKEASYKIYHTEQYPSRLLLPVIPKV